MPRIYTTKLTPELQASIVADLNTGLFASQVALKNGVHPETIQIWVSKGLESDAAEPYASFAEAYIKADIHVEQQCLAVIRSGAENKKFRKTKKVIQAAKDSPETTIETQYLRGDWRAAAWYAEKRWPRRYGTLAQQLPGKDDLDMPQIIEAAQSRGQTLVELLSDPPPELEQAIILCKDQILALLNSKKLTG
jgi:hypothetical protein